MDKQTLVKIIELLNKEKQELLSKSQQKVHVDTDGDETDEIQANVLIEINNQLNNRNSLKIKKIDEALNRIEQDLYGMCDDCGEDIPEKRLLINPHFFLCVSCAEKQELKEKQRKRY